MILLTVRCLPEVYYLCTELLTNRDCSVVNQISRGGGYEGTHIDTRKLDSRHSMPRRGQGDKDYARSRGVSMNLSDVFFSVLTHTGQQTWF